MSKQTNQISALYRVRHFLTFEQAKVLADALSNFRHYPIIWMFCGKCCNSLIMKGACHERVKEQFFCHTKTNQLILCAVFTLCWLKTVLKFLCHTKTPKKLSKNLLELPQRSIRKQLYLGTWFSFHLIRTLLINILIAA